MYKRTVIFRDTTHTRWVVNFELRNNSLNIQRSRATLQELNNKYELSVTGEGGCSCGQCYEYIAPRTPGQKQLLDIWHKYHLNNMSAGTVKQDDYLNSQEYRDDYNKFVDLFIGYDKEHRQRFDKTNWDIFCKSLQIYPDYVEGVKTIILKYMSDNPIVYILGLTAHGLSHQIDDLYVKYLFLAIHGLYNDRGYKYGSGWLHDELPVDIEQQIDSLCDLIEQEEKSLSSELNPVFDMGNEDFVADECIIQQVMDLRQCDRSEAMRFIALGMHLKYTFGDLNDTFNIEDSDLQLYTANGTQYYLGTEDELIQIAEDTVHNDSEYEYFWREAVSAGRTQKSLKEWLDSIVPMDGWCSVLNHWNGEYHEYEVGKECICVSLT